MKDGFIKAVAASPEIRVGDPAFNARSAMAMIDRAHADGAALLVLPELCVTGYTCGDLFTQSLLIGAAEQAIVSIAAHTRDKPLLVVCGTPLATEGRLYNTAAVLANGEILGVVPKAFPPGYGEFSENRYFATALHQNGTIDIAGKRCAFGPYLLFACRGLREFVLGVEICEDLFVADSPCGALSLAGATVIANTSASDELMGKPEFRRALVAVQSAKNTGAYVYANSPRFESTTDLVYSAHNIIAENGEILSESEPFGAGYAVADLDLSYLESERRHKTLVRRQYAIQTQVIEFSLPMRETPLTRVFEPLPFIPPQGQGQRCREAMAIQSQALRRRMEHTGAAKAVIGVSGGLDSTLTLLVAERALRLMGRPASDVLAVSMPCFGTTARTRDNARRMCALLGTDFREIDITASVTQHLKDIGLPQGDTGTTFENAQARERTQVLMDLANRENGLVVGTGNLSELALGWCTYNGDHMSMYAVNCSVPKTLVRALTRCYADEAGGELKDVLYDVLDTPVSPELLPAAGENGITQKTEDLIGPYELHDFFLYHMILRGDSPQKIRRLAGMAFAGKYGDTEIVRWLKLFLRRFFSQQFKRSCSPNGPKVGPVGLSPRGDWRMPSDAVAEAWLAGLE